MDGYKPLFQGSESHYTENFDFSNFRERNDIYSFVLGEGPLDWNNFSWAYIKDGADGSTSSEVDCAWIDDITFPPSAINDDNLLGDVNQDGSVSVLDVIQMINMVLGNSETDLIADINSDGVVDVIDIILVVNIILDV